MDPLTFTLTRTELESKRSQLAQSGIHLQGDSGTFTAQSCTIDFFYTEPYLSVLVTDKPFFASEALVASKIREWFRS
jgi:hypothetical protein